MTTDANDLEEMAKEHPNACFLKGSGVLKLIGAIRTLEAEVAALKAQPAPTEAQGALLAQLDCDIGTKQVICSAAKKMVQGKDSARLDALASEIEGMAPAHDRGCFGKRSDFDHYAEGHEYARKAAAARVREFAAAPQPQEQS